MLNSNQTTQLLNLLNVASFCIGLMNLDENITQGDMQDLQQDFATRAESLLKEIHEHLNSQDKKLDNIMRRLENLENDT